MIFNVKNTRVTLLLITLSILGIYTLDAHAQRGRGGTHSHKVYPPQSMTQLKGIVSSSAEGALELATVYLEGTNIHTTTDERGRYTLSVPAGKHTLIVRYVGYKEYKQSLEIRQGQRLVHNIRLEASEAAMLREAVVVGKSRAKDLRDQGFAVQVVEVGRIATQSIQSNELLERTAGVKIRQEGGLGSRVNYNINGLSGNAVKIFIDGVPAANYGSTFSLGSIPPAMIERIEVYKGVLPGYLSDDALGGAINVILKEQQRNTLSTSYSIGSFNTHQWNIMGSHRSKRGFALEGSAFYNYSDNDYKVWGRDVFLRDHMGAITYPDKPLKRFHDAYRSVGGKVSVGVRRRPWADKLMLTGLLSSDYKEVQHGITMQNVYGDRYTRRQAAVLSLAYAKRNFLIPGLSINLDASLSKLKRQVIDTVGIMYDWAGRISDGQVGYVRYTSGAEVGNAPTLGINDEHTTMLRVQASYAIATGSTIYANYLYNDFRRKVSDELADPLVQTFVNVRDLQKSVLALTYEQLAFDDRLRANIFYKHYFQTVTSHEPYLSSGEVLSNTYEHSINHSGYGMTASFAITPSLQLLASGEQALRLPNANEIFGNVAENLLPPSPELEPERSLNLNIGAQYAFNLQRHHFSVNGSLYYRGVTGMIREAIQTGSFTYSRFENLESVLSRGFDLEFNYDYDSRLNFRFGISKFATLFNTKYDKLGDPYRYYGMQIRNEPSLKFNAQLSYTFRHLLGRGDRLLLHSNFNYVEGFLRNWANVGSANLASIPTQKVVDAGLSYSLPGSKLTLSLDAKNVFDRQAFDNFGLQKPGRAFYAKVTYNIF